MGNATLQRKNKQRISSYLHRDKEWQIRPYRGLMRGK
nr:MAG TPA: hypothetical protein [Caudoviricetes sp.]